MPPLNESDAVVRELVKKVSSHPSVVAWSLANEPHSRRPEAHAFFANLVALARGLDPTRPVTLVSYLGADETSFELCDFVSVNRYNGWYTQSGRIAEGMSLLSADLDRIHERFGKPVLLSEFGADADFIWDELLKHEWIKLIDKEDPTRASVTAIDQRESKSLDEKLKDKTAKIEDILDRAHIGPVNLAAKFSGPQEIREGWLKLSAAQDVQRRAKT